MQEQVKKQEHVDEVSKAPPMDWDSHRGKITLPMPRGFPASPPKFNFWKWLVNLKRV
jgi:hypothetical protein